MKRSRNYRTYLEPHSTCDVPERTEARFKRRTKNLERPAPLEEISEDLSDTLFDHNDDDQINVNTTVYEENLEGFQDLGEFGFSEEVSVELSDHDDDDQINLDSTVHEEDNSDSFFNKFNVKINCSSNVTVGESILLIHSYVNKYHLSQSALDDLLKMINHFLGEDILPTSKYIFNKILSSFTSTPKYHYYCSTCLKILEISENTGSLECSICQNKTKCSENVKFNNFYMTTSVETQLKSLLKNEKVAEHLIHQRPFYNDNASSIKDIFDGLLYKKLLTDTSESSEADTLVLTLQFTTDGVSIFKSSQYSLWPLLVVVNELPPILRLNNVLFLGLWCGKEKPVMESFLTPVLKECESLSKNGFMWKFNCRTFHVYVKLILCCPDSVARPVIQNSTQYNGLYGCTWCLHPTHQIYDEVSQRKIRRYTFSKTVYPKRDTGETIKLMFEALDCAQNKQKEDKLRLKGMKGTSPLLLVSSFDVVYGFSPDYMHGVLLGVVRHILDLWLTLPREPFFLGSTDVISELNNRILSIKTPAEVTRRPRAVSERAYWKANEYRNWLLFYSIPCLKDLLPQKYLMHFCLLVKAMYILLKEEITHYEVNLADSLLLKFALDFQFLYGERHMVFNYHQLLHFAQSVKHWGPLWAHSAFSFEHMNGY